MTALNPASTATKSLKRTMLLGAVISAALVFVIILIISSKVFTQNIKQQSEHTSETLISLSFNNMYQIMSKGWSRQELQNYLNNMEQTFEKQGLKFSLYRANIVNAQFGQFNSNISPEMFPIFKQVELSKLPSTIETDAGIQIFRPLIAKDLCLKCHTQAKVGDVLGIMSVEQPVNDTINAARNDFIIMLLIIMPLPMAIAGFIGYLFTQSVVKSIAQINTYITSINQVDDLSKLSDQKNLFSYQEFGELNHSLNLMGEKLKHIAIDRDILDFEIQLLDKLILSSELIKDWKQHICLLMNEINQILPLYTMFVVFRTDDLEQYRIEIFWIGKPSPETEQMMTDNAKQLVNNLAIFAKGSIYTVSHTYASQTPITVENKIQTQSKSLMLETPKIGGVVGIGVETFPPKDSSRSVVVESVLTTLVNVIGSIKAINKFTKELEYYATRDPLTHLFNQRVFTEMLTYEVKRASIHNDTFALLMIDFDNFKLINDQYGHTFGDEVLRAFARNIKAILREGDIFARYGGDEFCIILPEYQLEQAKELAHNILSTTTQSKLTSPKGDQVSMNCSIGIAIYPEHADNREDLFMVADNMLYRVKDSGKNAFAYPNEEDLVSVYKESNDQSLFIIHSLETGEPIVPHYQPIVNMHTGEIEVHELLMRLQQDGELISAARFIETAEHMGLVNQMDLILIEKAMANIAHSNYRGVLFINLSPKAIIASEFINKIQSLTQKYNIDHDRIVFEITERETVGNISVLEKFVKELRSEGYRFAIDDFGSGFSSFQYLKRFPVDFLKIEGEFINNMSKNKIDLAFVESAVSMAKSLEIRTIAEFIENDETLKLVKALGIDYAQGYRLATPQPAFLKELPNEVVQIINSAPSLK